MVNNKANYNIDTLTVYTSWDGEYESSEVPARYKCVRCGKVYSFDALLQEPECTSFCESPFSALVNCCDCDEQFGEHEADRHKCKVDKQDVG